MTRSLLVERMNAHPRTLPKTKPIPLIANESREAAMFLAPMCGLVALALGFVWWFTPTVQDSLKVQTVDAAPVAHKSPAKKVRRR